jgi:hypothetical protein
VWMVLPTTVVTHLTSRKMLTYSREPSFIAEVALYIVDIFVLCRFHSRR